MNIPKSIGRYFLAKSMRKAGLDYPTARFLSMKILPWGRKR